MGHTDAFPVSLLSSTKWKYVYLLLESNVTMKTAECSDSHERPGVAWNNMYPPKCVLNSLDGQKGFCLGKWNLPWIKSIIFLFLSDSCQCCSSKKEKKDNIWRTKRRKKSPVPGCFQNNCIENWSNWGTENTLTHDCENKAVIVGTTEKTLFFFFFYQLNSFMAQMNHFVKLISLREFIK